MQNRPLAPRSLVLKPCESKIEEANGAPALRAKDEEYAPDTEATGRTFETNSPYIVVGTFEGLYPSNTFAGLPDTPAVLPPAQVQRLLEPLGAICTAPEKGSQRKRSACLTNATTAKPADATDADEGAEEEEDDKHVAPEAPHGTGGALTPTPQHLLWRYLPGRLWTKRQCFIAIRPNKQRTSRTSYTGRTS